MNFAADIGNTVCKLGIFDGDKLLKVILSQSLDELAGTLNGYPSGRVIIGSVSEDPGRLIANLSGNLDHLQLNHSTPLPISLGYGTPETLGVDRIAAVCGAHHLSPGNNCLVIDIGTCITYDYLDAKGSYWGGAISPGVRIKSQSLKVFTANLPLVEPDFETNLVGNSTRQSIASGIFHGTAGEIESMIGYFKDELKSDLRIYLCGGDARMFESKIKAPIFVVPELVLLGLNQILLWND